MTDLKYGDSSTVLYFSCFLYGLILIPSTYFLWPSLIPKQTLISSIQQCNCHGCTLKALKVCGSPKTARNRLARFIGIFFFWVIFFYIAYHTLTQEVSFTLYDPWEELGVYRDSSSSDIKKKYHEMSLIYHPDMKTGDSEKFMAISKAYKTLTNPEMLKTFYETGDPNGKKSIDFSIALPTWLSNKKYSTVILLVYGICFLVLLPTIVGIWWHRSMKYTNTKIINETSKMFGFCLHTYPHSNIQRIKMILMCACEFSPVHSKKFPSFKPEDEQLLLALAEKLPHAKHKLNLKPFNIQFSVKARILLQSYLDGIDLDPRFSTHLEYILTMCPTLWEHLTNICTEMMAYFKFQQAQNVSQHRKLRRQTQFKNIIGPNLETLENILKLGSMITQKLTDLNSSPLLQLPHIDETEFKHFTTKKRRVRSLADIANLKEEERRKLLRHLTEDEYFDVLAVLSGMPKIDMQIELEIVDLKDSSRITPGALVTVNIYLQRTNLLPTIEVGDTDNTPEETVEDNIGTILPVGNTKSTMIRSNTKRLKVSKKVKNQNLVRKVTKTNLSPEKIDVVGQAQSTNNLIEKEHQDLDDVDEDKEFELLQKTILKKNKSKLSSRDELCSFPVHCPNFCGTRHEGWWLYMSDFKSRSLVAAPKFISCLVNTLEAELKFQAPLQIGHYQYEVLLISDSYVGLNCKQPCAFTVYSSHSQQENFDYGLDEYDKEIDNDFIEQEETTSTEESESDDSGLDTL